MANPTIIIRKPMATLTTPEKIIHHFQILSMRDVDMQSTIFGHL